MIGKLATYKCNDQTIKEVYRLYMDAKIKAGEIIKRGNKTYCVENGSCVSSVKKDDTCKVFKKYSLNNGNEWMLTSRDVTNNRGSYSRFMDIDGTESVSLGGQYRFEQQLDGNYIQNQFPGLPAKTASSEEIEAAIDYVKGKGAKENYTKLLQEYKN